ncbi:hypothetical protein CAOG_04573 [Capsaspora owczarzaki ATCC 30864]|uniref:Translocon-associated protein subunit gamma n=1 Tax=Capsaspora owczarzaki (strain ATCC 30864) TaxID=595528 RepID=A0A0D2UFE6_CAPO3|nr:hypothetical protein CAOG_04573 [Capsaspora owczarzaki ATCC 30864]KJE93846.1 hypothetical protein CAOG_004573 [Capsaspora owczarzaki ATCC 30864]|eukprot:XP_004347320.1 hypothetical protein CAOG_04573 [Capsaspora owczarzaki ATCC 30864]
MGKASQAEHKLLDEHSMQASKLTLGQKICYLVNGALIAALPAYAFHSIQHIKLSDNLISHGIAVILTIATLFFAYHNVASVQKRKIYKVRLSAVEESMRSGSKTRSPDFDKQAVKKANEIAAFESVALSLFYNNALFVAIQIVFAFYLFKNWEPQNAYVGSTVVASGIVALLATGK